MSDSSKHDGPPSLNEVFSDWAEAISNIQKAQPGVWELIDGAFTVARLTHRSVLSDDISWIETHLYMIWGTVLEYQMDSLYLMIGKKFDPAFALLRMASELARDTARIGASEEMLNIGLDRLKKETRKPYRDKFRFDDSDATEKFVHGLYDIASNFSVHGHTMTSISARPKGVVMDGKYVVLAIPDIEIYKNLSIWLKSFFPLQTMCARAFMKKKRLKKSFEYFEYFEQKKGTEGLKIRRQERC